MKKIMFNDKYGLTNAVLNGDKTMTRRIIKAPRRTIEGKEVCGFAINKTSDGVPYEVWLTGPDEESLCQLLPTYQVGEIVAVAQRYSDIADDKFFVNEIAADELTVNAMKYEHGWINKQGVKACYMPHHIRITNIKIERLQNISEEDCLKEGVYRWGEMKDCLQSASEFERNLFGFYGDWASYLTPRKAFADLIDKVGRKGTWDSNPWVFAYSFELID